MISNTSKGNDTIGTEEPPYNDSVCNERLRCKIEFAVIKKLDMDPSKALITDSFNSFLQIIHFVYLSESPRRGDSNIYPKTYVFCKNNMGPSMKKYTIH